MTITTMYRKTKELKRYDACMPGPWEIHRQWRGFTDLHRCDGPSQMEQRIDADDPDMLEAPLQFDVCTSHMNVPAQNMAVRGEGRKAGKQSASYLPLLPRLLGFLRGGQQMYIHSSRVLCQIVHRKASFVCIVIGWLGSRHITQA